MLKLADILQISLMDKLKDSFFQAYFNMPVPRIIVRANEPEYTVIAINKAYITVTNLTNDAAVEESVFNLFGAQQANRLNNALDNAISINQTVNIPEFEVSSVREGSNLLSWWQIEIFPVAEEGKKPEYLILTTRDVTQNVLDQRALIEAGHREQTLHEELAATNEELSASNEELNATVEDLKRFQENLQELNETLEERVKRRTEDLIKTQHQLSRQYTLLETIVNEVPAGICVLKGPEMVLEAVNTKLLDMWKRGKEIIGQPLVEVMPEIREQEFPRILAEVYRSGIAYYNNDARAELNLNGIKQVVYRDYSYTPLKNAYGTTHSILALTIDVTERTLSRQREQQLVEEQYAINEELTAANEELAATNEELHEAQEIQRKMIDSLAESEAKLGLAIEAAQMGSWHIDRKTKELNYNPALATLFGYEGTAPMTYDQAIAQVTEDCRERLVEEIEKAISDGGDYDVTYTQHRFNDNEVIWLRSLGKIIPDDQGNYTVFSGVVMNITEQKKDEQRKNDFIGMVSHELKTPLTSLNGYAQILQSRAKKNDDAFSISALGKVNEQVRKMTAMINGFLNISRLESGKIHLNKRNFDLNELIAENIEEAAILAGSHQIVFEYAEAVTVFADRDKIGSVISNMISNAVKYSPERKDVAVRCQINGPWAQISVKDQGIGISAEDLPKLFDRFYRVENNQTQLISGFGIGLYLSAEIIESHHGKIWVESEPGQGSTFFFNLPAV